MGFTEPTPIQAAAVPLGLQGKDILARARTGSGKTAAYCLPVIQKILSAKQLSPGVKCCRALFLVPTRELAEQVHRNIKEMCVYATSEITCVNVATADVSINNQRPLLQEGPDIIVATPSKILTHIEAGNIILKESVESLVIDEADLMLSFGYEEDVRKILSHLPRIYQSYLMSATMSDDVQQLKQLILRNPAILKLQESDSLSSGDLLTQFSIRCDEHQKFLLTFFLLKLRVHPFGTGKTIIFVNSVDRCYKLKLFLEQFGVASCTLNPELPLKSRHHVVQEFNRGVYDIIIATDEGQHNELSDDEDGDDDLDNDDEEEMQEDTADNDGKKRPLPENEGGGSSAAAGGESRQSKRLKRAQVAREMQQNRKKRRGGGGGGQKGDGDAESGVSRGIDFRNVRAVINFDLPLSSTAYMHRVGRTARGVGNKGWALSFVVPLDKAPVLTLPRRRKAREAAKESGEVPKILPGMFDEDVFARIKKSQAAIGRTIKSFTFDMKQVEAFSYRVEDAIRSVTKTGIKEARMKEIKQEILNSDKLKAHFEDNPKDLLALRHDKPLHPSRIQSHLKHVPDYLMPTKRAVGTVIAGEDKKSGSGGEASETAAAGEDRASQRNIGYVSFSAGRGRGRGRGGRGGRSGRGGSRGSRGGRGGRRGGGARGGKKAMGDPLKSFKI
ncbi:P-loop containing nucleoside triphosphate hydrolase protein [Zopfochytrium polystomum]|nr:P-loop containing nucleoside triphosphate hydrolase protein [Zopfochytrium polystomum]